MFPEYISLVLQDLGYLALIIIVPCTVFNTVQNLTIGLMIKNHIEVDNMRFADANKHLGKLDSQVEDIRMDRSSGLATRIETLLKTAYDHR
jgi:hypothetical protein